MASTDDFDELDFFRRAPLDLIDQYLREEDRPEPDDWPDEVLFGDPRGEEWDEEYELRTVCDVDVHLLDRYGGRVL